MTKISNNAERAINRFDKAAQEVSWVGSAHPSDRELIRKDYEKARAALAEYIANLEQTIRDQKARK